MLESDADRLAMIQAVGEQFDTGRTLPLWGVYDAEFDEAELGSHAVEQQLPVIECRTSDITVHELVKDSRLVRLSDDSIFFVRRIEPDGTGMSRVRLRR